MSARVSRWRLPAVVTVACLALVTVAIVLLVRAHHLRTSGPLGNQAMLDRSRTTEVTGEVTTALNQVLSYDYRRPATSRQAGAKWLTGDAPAQYRVLLGKLLSLSKGQNLTLRARVSKVGVSSLTDNTARLLVYLDQSSTRASDGASAVSAAQVQITAVRTGGTWKISELKPL